MSEPIKSILPYDMQRGGQVIEVLDLGVFKNNSRNKLDNYVLAKSNSLKKEYEELVDLWDWNNYVDEFKLNFEPVIGKTYFLYEGSTKFVSILSPTELTTVKHLGKTKLTSDGYWVKI